MNFTIFFLAGASFCADAEGPAFLAALGAGFLGAALAFSFLATLGLLSAVSAGLFLGSAFSAFGAFSALTGFSAFEGLSDLVGFSAVFFVFFSSADLALGSLILGAISKSKPG